MGIVADLLLKSTVADSSVAAPFHIVMYTIVEIDPTIWSEKGKDIKKVLDTIMIWRDDYAKKLNQREIIDLMERFKVHNQGNSNSGGIQGLWEGMDEKVKIVKTPYIVLFIHGGSESYEFKKTLKFLFNLGCQISRIEDGKITFQDRLNVKLISKLNDSNEIKDLRIKNFMKKIEILNYFGEVYGQKFIHDTIEVCRI